MKVNKKIFTAISLGLITTLAVSITAMAYFADKDKVNNKFSPDNNEISVSEPDFSTPDSIPQGGEIAKNPIIKATGTDCYVRVWCEFSDTSIDYATLNFNTTDWTEKQSDGYYYYKHKLTDGEETTPLFTKVKFDSSIDDTQLEKEFDIIVYSESAQAYDTYGHKEFKDYKEAWDFWNMRSEVSDNE